MSSHITAETIRVSADVLIATLKRWAGQTETQLDDMAVALLDLPAIKEPALKMLADALDKAAHALGWTHEDPAVTAKKLVNEQPRLVLAQYAKLGAMAFERLGAAA